MIHAKKSLGQNFLHDQGVLARIADLAQPEAGSGLLEIGPGTGNLTAHLLPHLPPDWSLTVIERDRRMVPLLAERFGDRVRVKLVHTDPERGFIDFDRIGHEAVGAGRQAAMPAK